MAVGTNLAKAAACASTAVCPLSFAEKQQTSGCVSLHLKVHKLAGQLCAAAGALKLDGCHNTAGTRLE